MGFVNGVSAIGSTNFVDGVGRGVMDGVIGDGVGQLVLWMAWVSGLAMAWVSGSTMA